MKQLTSKEVKIGIVTIVALGVLIFGINYLKGVNIFKPSTYYYVKFKDVNGLAKSSPVFADGYRVGIVHDIVYDYNHPGNIDVEVELDKLMRVPKNTTAVIVSSLMGTLRLNLIIPREAAGFCAIGDTITGGLDSGMMETVQQLVPAVEKLLPKIDSILTSVNALVSDPSIRASLHSIQTTTSNLADASYGLKRLMNKDVPRLTKKMDMIGDNAIAITDHLKGIDFKSSMANIDSTLRDVKMITGKLNSKDNTMGLFLNDRALYDNLNSTFIGASSLLQDLKANPKRYVHFSLFGRKNNK
ncbi:MAG: MCE family protein [Bacteroidales bacterium]|nr:MCE family protein [Bacteroidales bacterium]